MSVEVDARFVEGSGVPDGYGIVCRARTDGHTFARAYTFLVWSDSAWALVKYSDVEPYVTELAAGDLGVNAGEWNRLRAVCADNEEQEAVDLQFWINGELVGEATDVDRPLSGGAIGLFASSGREATDRMEGSFDDFVVKKP